MCKETLGLFTALNSFKITRQSVDLHNVDRLPAVCYYIKRYRIRGQRL